MFKSTRQFIAIIAFIGFGLSFIAHAVTFFGVSLAENSPWIWGLHIGIFPLFFLIFISSFIQGQKRLNWKVLFKPMSRPAQMMIIGFLIYAVVNFALFFYLSQGGTPDIRDGQYILHNHGTLIRELTETEYRWQLAYILRGFSGHWMIFYLFIALYFWYPKTVSLNTPAGSEV